MNFSLIIPYHGNTEQLERLLATVPQRDDLQVITVYDELRRGAGWARNQGLTQSTGDYVFFADSDDWFMPCISELLDGMAGESADIVYFNATAKEEGSGKPSWRADRLNWIMFQNEKRREFLLRHTFTEPWCHIVKRSFIEKYHIRFDETPILNDVTFSTQCGYHAGSIAVKDLKAYCVCNHSGSTAKQRGDDQLQAYTEVMAKVNSFNRTHGIRYYHVRMLHPFFSCLSKGRWQMMCKCVKIIMKHDYSSIHLLWLLLTYPFYVIGWMYRKRCYHKCA